MNQPNQSVSELSTTFRRDVESICFSYGRKVGRPGHAEAEAVLLRRMEAIGCRPYAGDSIRMPFRSGEQDFVNLIGVIPGRAGAGKAPMLIGAHYDSVIDAPCADDNAAAVAIALSVAEAAVGNCLFERDLIVAIFDSEEPPYFLSDSMGSNYFAAHQMKPEGVHSALIMDLVGHDVPGVPGLESLVFVMGVESHPELQKAFTYAPHPETLKVAATLNRYVGDMSDHSAFRKRGVPYFFLSCGHWQHYHQTTDTPDRLNYEKMAAIVKLNLNFLRGMDALALARSYTQETLCDTVAMEIAALEQAFGPALPMLLGRIGVRSLASRNDIDCFVRAMKSGLGL